MTIITEKTKTVKRPRIVGRAVYFEDESVYVLDKEYGYLQSYQDRGYVYTYTHDKNKARMFNPNFIPNFNKEYLMRRSNMVFSTERPRENFIMNPLLKSHDGITSMSFN